MSSKSFRFYGQVVNGNADDAQRQKFPSMVFQYLARKSGYKYSF
jgi:hypothetical protein